MPSHMFASIFKLRCPACGVGKLYHRYLKINPVCTHCALPLAKYDAADGPAYVVMFLVGLLVTLAAVYTEFHYEVPLWLHLVAWPPLILLMCLALLPSGKAFFMVMLYRLKVDDNA